MVRFCVIPNEGGYCSPNAFVQFTLDGEEIQQPIGVAGFEAESMKISVPEITSLTSVVVNGVATADSEVRIYDNGVLVGTTYSLANGQWSSKVELYKPYDWSCHSMSAEIVMPNGQNYSTDIKRIEYRKNYSCLSKITMIYCGTSVIFDPIERTTSTNTYSYVPGNDEFTFTAEFTNTDTSLVRDMTFVVLASDGTTRTLEPEYNDVKKLWVAKSKYSNSKKLPVNITAKWLDLSSDSIDNYGFMEEEANMLIEQNKRIANFWDKKDSVIVLEDTESSFTFKYVDEELQNLEWIVSERDYEKTLSLTDSIQFNYGNDGENWFCYHLSSDEEALKVILVDFGEKMAFDIVVRDETYDVNRVSMRKLNIANAVTGVGGGLLDLIGVRDYMTVNTDLQAMLDFMNQTSSSHSKMPLEINKLLAAKCENGDKRITPTVESFFRFDLADIISEQNNYLITFEKYIEEYRVRLRWNVGLNVASMGVGTVLNGLIRGGRLISKLGGKLLDSMGHGKTWWAIYSQSVAESVVGNAAGIAYSITEETVNNIFQPDFSDFTEQRNKIWSWAPSASNSILEKYSELGENIKSAYRTCPKDKEEDDDENDDSEGKNKNKDKNKDKNDDFPNPPLTPSIDPAGYVYEGVSSNRVEGVTATCYYKETVEDMYGDLRENVVLWNAEEYAQENPLFTDENGMYQWFVPQGLWQVKFEKEGYETTYSEWLPVPPPQLEVNIAMVQNKQPEVKTVHAYEDGIVVEFDKYMQPATLNTDNIFVVQNGATVAGTVILLNEEVAYEGQSETYASKVRFAFDESVTAEEVTLTISNRVKSYAGVQMQEAYTQTFDIEQEITGIVADSLVSMYYGGEYTLTVRVMPAAAAARKTLVVTLLSPMILTVDTDSVLLDNNGEATITVTGELPGTGVISYELIGYAHKASTIVEVDYENTMMTANPTASIPSETTVEEGTEVTLNCITEGAAIYYTLDGSCPCDESARILYDGTPITINRDTELRMIAVAEGRYESDVVVYYYFIESTDVEEVILPFGISPTLVKDGFRVQGIETECSVSVYCVSGELFLQQDHVKDNTFINMSHAAEGMYIVVVSKNDDIYKQRILKME